MSMDDYLLLIPLILLMAAVGYPLLLAAASLFSSPGEKPGQEKPRSRFAVVVPAHDEEGNMAATLSSLETLDYPGDMYEVVVVADNCTDATAAEVRSRGVRCLERHDPGHPGKGHALEHAFDMLLPEGFDAFVVIDADTVADADILRILDARLARGEKAVQVRYGVLNPEASPLTAMLAVGNSMENDLFSKGKEVLGLTVFLRGNGMCLSADLLREHPWRAHSVAEDTEYGIMLARARVRVGYAGNVQVRAAVPQTLDQLRTQRVRWASGNSKLSRLHSVKLLMQGVVTRDLLLADTGWSLLVRSKPLLLLLSLFAAILALAGMVPAVPGLAPAAGLTAYFAAGVVRAGLSWRRLGLLALAPRYMFWLVVIALAGLTNYRGDSWLRTERT
jgi:cellulose synthase/poly-beta-1,6-N-acetylglucosamine synthase-like glycosyltransferase